MFIASRINASLPQDIDTLASQISIHWRVVAIDSTDSDHSLEGVARLCAQDLKGAVKKQVMGIVYPLEKRQETFHLFEEQGYFYGTSNEWNANTRSRLLNLRKYEEQGPRYGKEVYRVPLAEAQLPQERVALIQLSLSYLREELSHWTPQPSTYDKQNRLGVQILPPEWKQKVKEHKTYYHASFDKISNEK